MKLLILHCLLTAYMTGVIWFVQVVHYPSFRWMDVETFRVAMHRHQHLTTIVVGPPMLLEAGTGIALLLMATGKGERIFLALNLLAIVALWLFTYLVSVPKHQKLLSGYDLKTIQKLVSTNWPRTLIWTWRSALLFFLVSMGG